LSGAARPGSVVAMSVPRLPIVPNLAAGAPDLRVPLLRREPYRLLFPLGLAFSWIGVSPWLLFALGLTEEWLPVFHALVQVQCFLACMASGFLFTMIPRRTAGAPAAAWEVALAALAPFGTAAFAFAERWALSQLFWVVSMATLLQFALRRFRARAAVAKVPSSFVWVPLALLFALVAPVLAGIGAARGEEGMWLHDVGRNLALQGVVSALVVGVGSLIVPHLARGDAPAEPRRAGLLLHLSLALAFAGSFLVEQIASVPLAHALRAACVAAALVPAARLWRKPTLPEAHRWLAWLAAWALPVGYALVALFPAYRKPLLHVVFIGSFGALTLSVAAHVALTHAGMADRLARRGAVPAMAALLGAALGARFLVDLDAPHLRLWLGMAASCFVLATLVWATLAGRALGATPRSTQARRNSS
jgi:uncharacterized protein involved in response to NO